MKDLKEEVKYLQIGSKTVQFKFIEPEQLDISDIIRIKSEFLYLESLTFPVVLNRIHNLLVEAEEQVKIITAESKVFRDDLEAKEGELSIYYHQKLKAEISSPTVAQVKGKIMADAAYQNIQLGYRKKQREIVEAEKVRDYISSLYWSAKAKMDVILGLIQKVPITIEDVVKFNEFNGVKIKSI